jgi:hypothetical protein
VNFQRNNERCSGINNPLAVRKLHNPSNLAWIALSGLDGTRVARENAGEESVKKAKL